MMRSLCTIKNRRRINLAATICRCTIKCARLYKYFRVATYDTQTHTHVDHLNAFAFVMCTSRDSAKCRCATSLVMWESYVVSKCFLPCKKYEAKRECTINGQLNVPRQFFTLFHMKCSGGRIKHFFMLLCCCFVGTAIMCELLFFFLCYKMNDQIGEK